MPIYEYACKACHKEFEYQQRMADPDKTVCEACGGELERLISRTAFQLKGSGWYKDLYSSSKPEAKPSDAKTESSTPASGSTDSGTSATPAPATGGDKGSGDKGSGGGSSTSKAAASAS
jgi:putative FmdB family regulatory protein